MKLVKLRLFLILITSCFFMVVSVADITFSGSSSNSISISIDESETNKAYILEIYIKGIASSSVSFKAKGQTLTLKANQGNIGENSLAGGQSIVYSFSFTKNANMDNISRLNSKNKIRITIPKQ